MQVRVQTLTANVTAINGNTVNEGLVDFTINGTDAGTSPVTDDAATLDWTIPQIGTLELTLSSLITMEREPTMLIQQTTAH